MYEILVTGPLCNSEWHRVCCFPANLCNRALDVIVETTCNADMLTVNASEDFQYSSQSDMNDYKTHSEENQSDHMS